MILLVAAFASMCWSTLVAAAASEIPIHERAVSSEVSLYTGTSTTETTSIVINQQGFPATTIDNVRFANKPFTPPPYYGLRYRRDWKANIGPFQRVGTEIELVHYKIYYESGDDPDGIIQQFDVTDGLNLVYVNALGIKQLRDDLSVSARLGMGPIIAHPETEIRHQKKGQNGDWSGFEYAGLTWQVAVALEKAVAGSRNRAGGSKLFIEYKHTAADPTISISGGTATTSTRAHHFIAGWSIRL